MVFFRFLREKASETGPEYIRKKDVWPPKAPPERSQNASASRIRFLIDFASILHRCWYRIHAEYIDLGIKIVPQSISVGIEVVTWSEVGSKRLLLLIETQRPSWPPARLRETLWWAAEGHLDAVSFFPISNIGPKGPLGLAGRTSAFRPVGSGGAPRFDR